MTQMSAIRTSPAHPRGWSYRVKVPLLIIVISLATALAISFAIAVSAKQWLTEDLHDHATAVAESLARGLVIHMARDDVWEAFEAVKGVSNVEGGPQRCDVVVLDRSGSVFVSSDPKRFGVRQSASVLTAPLSRVLQVPVQPGASVVVDAKDSTGTYSVIRTPLLSTDQELIGTLLMSYSHAVFAQRYLETLKTLALITIGLVLVLLPLGWWLGHRLAIPLTRVTEALYRLAKVTDKDRDLSTAEPRSEIARLEDALLRLQAQLKEKAELQRQFIAADRLAAIGRMTSGVAHEINNPLAGMLNALSNLRRDPSLLPKTVGLLERGLDQIRQTLSALLIETKTQSRPLTPADIEDLRLLVASQADRKRLELVWAYRIDGDLAIPAAPVRQIVLNLLLNAVHASERWIKFDAALVKDSLVFRVVNDGNEFPPSKRLKPFAPLASGEGHGLGLWASHQLATSLGGTITLASDSSQTEFEVRLPLQRAWTQSIEASAAEAA
ncbi:MAG: HAMP domain-containing histidine kinase [Burkholderiales bacterium]|nr:HAMP domain-containing histidine kinase [Burkholderiales bacterium]